MRFTFGQPARLALAALLLVACDGDRPAVDPSLTDGCVGCEGDARIEVPDDGVAPDARPPGDAGPLDAAPDALPDAAPDAEADAEPDAAPLPCDLDAAVDPGPSTLEHMVIRHELPVGGPPMGGELLALDLDGDPEQAVDPLVIRGGRLTAPGRWQTPVLGLRVVDGAVDLDGDGRREVIAHGLDQLYVFDGLTGETLWSLPPQPLGEGRPPFSSVGRVLLADVDGDERPELYVTDAGCGGEGTGDGLVLTFAEGAAQGRILSVISGPRRGGRCATWHTLADFDGDGLPELLISDADGLLLFDPRTGQRLHCGPIPEPPLSAALPHQVAPLLAGAERPEVVVFVDRRVLVLSLHDDGGCGGTPGLRPRWSVDTGGDVSAAGSALLDLDGDGTLDVVTSTFADGQWRVLGYSGVDGSPLAWLEDARALGPVDRGDAGPALLVRRGDAEPRPARFGRVELLAVTPRAPFPLTSVWAVDAAAPLTASLMQADRTRELTRPVALPVAGDVVIPLLRAQAAGNGPATRLELGPGGRADALSGDPGVAAWAPEDAPARMVLAWPDGRLMLYDAAALGEPRALAAAPTGEAAAVTAWDGVRRVAVTLTAAGTLGALDLDRPDALYRWQRAQGPRAVRAPVVVSRGARPDAVVVAAPRDGAATWDAVDVATGELAWRHRLDPVPWLSVGQPAVVPGAAGEADLVLRYDFLMDPAAHGPGAGCPADVTNTADLFAPDPACPASVVILRVVTALDGDTGACRWRTVLRPSTACFGPGNQTVSVADGDGDGVPEVWVTESDGLVRLTAATGAIEEAIRIPRTGGGARGGGWIRETGQDPPLLRVGGNGPIEALAANLEPRWLAAAPEGLRDQAWTSRDVLVVGDEVWLAPGRSRAIHRYAVGAEGPEAELRGTIGLLDGEVVADELGLAGVGAPIAAPDLFGAGEPGVLVHADDGHLYALAEDGALRWARAFGATVGAPVLDDVDGDGATELVLPVGDGRVLVGDEPGPPAPPAAWDLPCPPFPSCPADDIDVTSSTTELCAAWIGVMGAGGYQVRVLAPNDAVIVGWTDVGRANQARLPADLLPGLVYRVEVRALDAGGQPSAGTPTDGVRVSNGEAPRVEVTVDRPQLRRGEPPITITVRASDDDLLAGWTLIARTADGILVRRLAVAELAHREFETTRRWDGTDLEKRPLPPGDYEIVATFFDRARNVGGGLATLTICGDACP